jgi:hypothetical protein
MDIGDGLAGVVWLVFPHAECCSFKTIYDIIVSVAVSMTGTVQRGSKTLLMTINDV